MLLVRFMKSIKTFPAEIWRKMNINPAKRVVMLTATSKRVRPPAPEHQECHVCAWPVRFSDGAESLKL